MILAFEQLDDRINPVVGATLEAVQDVPRGGFFDGVVRMGVDWVGTGGLIYTGAGQGFGHHILTAAHNGLGADIPIVFQLTRSGVDVDIPIIIPIGNGC